ncbi:MAG: Holliday junction branch migration protein RuvA [Saprospiraceae bacterium]
MFAYLKGQITYKSPTYIHVECGGVGYHVHISLYTYSKLENLDSIKILTYLHVKEDDQSLYGFFEAEEKTLFIQLLSVSGIGVNTARVILSYMNPEEVRTAIIQENAFALGKVKGIGPKTAKRIILDLKDKVMKESGDSPQVTFSDNKTPSVKNEALSALIALGFPKPAIEKYIKVIPDNQASEMQVEELIKHILKQMN